MNTSPLSPLSIIVPCQSSAELAGVRTTLLSLQSLALTSVEVVVITSLEGFRLEMDFSNVLVVHQKGQPDSPALVAALNATSSQLVTWLLPGERLLPEALQAALQVFENNSDIESVIGPRGLVNAEGSSTGINLPGIKLNQAAILEVWKHPAVVYALPLMRKSAWESIRERCTADNWWSWNYQLLCALGQRKVYYAQDVLVTLDGSQPEFSPTRLGEGSIQALTELSQAFWQDGSIRRWASWQQHRLNRVGKGQEKLRAYRAFAARKQPGRAFLYLLLCILIAPEVAFFGLFFPLLRAAAVCGYKKTKAFRAGDPRVKELLQVHTVWQDSWAGPYVIFTPPVTYPVREIVLSGQTYPAGSRKLMQISLLVNGKKVAVKRVPCGHPLLISARLDPPITEKPLQVEVITNRWFVPGLANGGNDFRPLSFQLFEIQFIGE